MRIGNRMIKLWPSVGVVACFINATIVFGYGGGEKGLTMEVDETIVLAGNPIVGAAEATGDGASEADIQVTTTPDIGTKTAQGSVTFTFPTSLNNVGTITVVGNAGEFGTKTLDVKVVKAKVDIILTGLTDATEDQGDGAKIHINDNFDEDQRVQDEEGVEGDYISDHLADPVEGTHSILATDRDLHHGSLRVEAVAKGELKWTIDPGVRVYWNLDGTWKMVEDKSDWTPPGEPISLRVEGYEIKSGKVKSSFTVDGDVADDTVNFRVYTGIRIFGPDAAAVRQHFVASTGLTFATGENGDLWRIGKSATATENWKIDARDYLDQIFVNAKQTSVDGVHKQRTLFGSYDHEEIDPHDITAVNDTQAQAAILIHEMVEQFRKQVHNDNYNAGDAIAVEAEKKVIGATSREVETTDVTPIPNTTTLQSFKATVTYDKAVGDGQMKLKFEYSRDHKTLQNVSFVR